MDRARKRSATANSLGRDQTDVQRALTAFEHEHERARERSQKVAKRAEDLRIHREAERRIELEEAGTRMVLPPRLETLRDALAKPLPPRRMAIHELLPASGNGVLVAQHKAGKTTLALNLAAALADGQPFLGRFKLDFPRGRVAYLDYEMDEAMFLSWARALEIRHPERIVSLHLRGQTLPFWESATRDALADWLIAREVKFLILDPAARAWSGRVENENDNTQVGSFTTAVDALKAEAGVDEAVVTHHTGRMEQREDEERARGATRLEDWMDAGWYLVKDRDNREQRTFRAIGRDVNVEALDLEYLPRTRRLRGGPARHERRQREQVQEVVDALAQIEANGEKPPTTTRLKETISGVEQKRRNGAILAAVEAKYVEREAGPRRAFLHRLTEKGKKLHGRRIRIGGDA